MNRKSTLVGLFLGVVALTLRSGSPAHGQADVTTTQTTLSVIFMVTNPCIGEPVLVTGTITEVSQTVATPSGKAIFVVATHSNLTGLGLTTGVTYQVQMPDQTSFFTGNPLPLVMTETFLVSFIGQGTAPNFVDHQTAHITVDANGVLTSFVSEENTLCQ